MIEKLLLLLEELNVNVQHIRDTQLQETKYLRNIGDVATYLNKSTKTINNYVKNGKFKINEHYFKDINGKIKFIPEGIMQYKKDIYYPFLIDTEPVSLDSMCDIHPITSEIIKSFR